MIAVIKTLLFINNNIVVQIIEDVTCIGAFLLVTVNQHSVMIVACMNPWCMHERVYRLYVYRLGLYNS